MSFLLISQLPKVLEGLIGGVGLLSPLQETLRQTGLAELGHAFQATQTIETWVSGTVGHQGHQVRNRAFQQGGIRLGIRCC